MAAFAQWCYRHRRIVVLAWVLALAGIGGLSLGFGTSYSDSFSLPGTQSTRALSLLGAAFPKQAGDTDTIAWHVSAGSVNDPAVRSRVQGMLAGVGKEPSVVSVAGPYGPAAAATGGAQTSKDGRTAYATITFNAQAQALKPADIQAVIDRAQAARTPTLAVELGGQAIRQASQKPTGLSELVGIAAAAVVLLLAFGSLFSMALPLVTAVVALGAGGLSVGLLSHAVNISAVGPTLGALIGLGVGIDYALFIVTRHRNGLKAGMAVEESAVRAMNTSGRAVLFAGATVCTALLGLLVMRLDFLTGLGVAGATMVAWTMVTALTLLPALLGFLGMRVLSRSERRSLEQSGPQPEASSGLWLRWSQLVARHPRPLALAAVAVLLALSIPTLSLRLGSSDAGNDPASSTSRRSYDMLAAGFGPGFNGPLQLVAELKSPADRAAFAHLAVGLGNTADVVRATALPLPPTSPIGIIQVEPASSPEAAATSTLIDQLRANVIPAAEQGTTLKVYVGGATAIFDDFASVLTGKLPQFLAVIVALAFLLLMLAFRSILVPATAAVMNILAAAASFGIVVAFFQWGWGSDPLGMGGAGPVEAFLPVIMIALLFGLSTDYQVFLVSRMHEEWVHTRDNERAVIIGQATTGRIITAAGTIMVFVFLAFILGGQRVIAEFGVGLSSAVLLDAFIIRTILVPALMHMFGARNWWLPGWLETRMPHLSVEPADEPVDQELVAQPATGGGQGRS
jgi:RND superfamily putative drug exporter